MTDRIIPYLQCLRNTFGALSPLLDKDPGTAMQSVIAAKLLDRMIVDYTTRFDFQAEYYAAVLKAQPAIEQALGGKAKDATSELKKICSSANADDFERFRQLSGDVQRAMVEVNTPQAMALGKEMFKLEAAYALKLEKAVEKQSVAAAASATAGAPVVRNTRAIDEKAIVEFIKKHYPDETNLGIAQTGFVPGGFSKFTAFINLANAKNIPANIILRGDAAATFGGASVVDEYRLIKTLYDNGACVPRPLAVDESGKVFGSPIMLVEKKPGGIIGHMYNLPKPNESVARDVAAQLAAIHKVPLAALGNQVDSANIPTSQKMLAWLDEGLKAWRPLNQPSPTFETAFDWLRKNVALYDKASRTLVHGDYGLNNILIHDDKVSTVLDWEFNHIGNPAYDLGYFYFMGCALAPWDVFLDAYEKAGMPVPSEEQMNYSILFAATRLGVMVVQTDHVFKTGAETGLAQANNLGHGYYEETIKRLEFALGRVM